MSANETRHNFYTPPTREIAGGDVTHEYLLPQIIQSLYDHTDDAGRRILASNISVMRTATDMMTSWQQFLLAFTSLSTPTYEHKDRIAEAIGKQIEQRNVLAHASFNALHTALDGAADAQKAFNDGLFDEATRLALKHLYETGKLEETLAHYSESLYDQNDGPVNALIDQNGSYFSFADSHGGGTMRKLDTSANSNNLNPLKIFEHGHEDEWPIVTLMSNTSAARDMDDIAVVAHGIENLYYAAQDGKADRPIRVISALHTEANSLENGKVIARRITNIQRDHEAGAEGNAIELDHHMHHRNLEGITPDVVRLGNLFLCFLLEDPAQIDIECPSLTTPFEEGALPPIRKNPDSKEPLKLRADYLKVAQHLRFAGYSRGGNIATDAWRYVARQLVGNGKTDGLQPSRFHQADGRELDETGAQEILAATGVLSIGAWETPASDKERELGLRRVSLVNANDHLIHEFVKANGGYDAYVEDDQLFVVEGVKKNIAHAPKPALTHYDGKPGYFADPNNRIINPCNRTANDCPLSIPAALKDFFSVEGRAKQANAETAREDASFDITNSVIQADSVALDQRIAAPALLSL